jgi:hypothetical protein
MTTLRIEPIFNGIGYKPHAAQRQFHASHTRNRVLACGRRFGKSQTGGGELAIEAVRTKILVPELEDSGKRREFWIVGPEYTDSEKEFRVLYNGLKKMDAPFDKPGTYYDAHSGDMQISMYGGKFLVIGKSAKHPERLVGEGLSGVVMAEAAKQKERTWTKYIRPTLADFSGWSIHSSTPEGKNWFYDLYMRGKDPNDLSWDSWRFGSWRNPYVYPKGANPKGLVALREAIDRRVPITPQLLERLKVDPEIAMLMLDLASETFNQEIAADFTEFAGRVFKDFDDEYHVQDLQFQSGWRTYACSDYGFTNPFVWLLVQESPFDGTVHVLEEIYETGLTIDDAAALIRKRDLDNVIEFFPDPARPEDTLALERHLNIRGNTDTGGLLDNRLRYIRSALKDLNTHLPEGHPERHPKLIIDRSCTNTIREMNDYRYPDTSKESNRNPKDQPMDKDNHCPEALGRFYRGRYGDPGASSSAGGTVVRRSTLSR